VCVFITSWKKKKKLFCVVMCDFVSECSECEKPKFFRGEIYLIAREIVYTIADALEDTS